MRSKVTMRFSVTAPPSSAGTLLCVVQLALDVLVPLDRHEDGGGLVIPQHVDVSAVLRDLVEQVTELRPQLVAADPAVGVRIHRRPRHHLRPASRLPAPRGIAVPLPWRTRLVRSLFLPLGGPERRRPGGFLRFFGCGLSRRFADDCTSGLKGRIPYLGHLTAAFTVLPPSLWSCPGLPCTHNHSQARVLRHCKYVRGQVSTRWPAGKHTAYATLTGDNKLTIWIVDSYRAVS